MLLGDELLVTPVLIRCLVSMCLGERGIILTDMISGAIVTKNEWGSSSSKNRRITVYYRMQPLTGFAF